MHKELFLGKWLNLSEQSVVLELLKEAQTIHVKRNSLLVEAGEIQQQVLVLVRGVARGFLLDVDGRDITAALCAGRVNSSWDVMPWGHRR